MPHQVSCCIRTVDRPRGDDKTDEIRDKFPVHAISYPVDADPNEPIILHETPSLTISGISLSPEASRTANEATAGPSSRSSGLPTSYETPDIRPDMRTTRPSLLSSDELSHWRNMVARGILGKPFGRPVAAPIPSDPIPAHDPSQPAPPATGEPFHHFDGYFHPSWPEQRFPLPLPSPAEQEADMVYFFQAPEVRGKLNVQKADTAGVPRLQRGDLTRGEAVEVDDPSAEGGKRVVRPEECLEGGGPGPALIVVSCSAANVDGLLASRAFHRYQPARSGAGVREGVSPHVVVHRVEHAVWADERYQAWMRAFGSDTQVSLKLPPAGSSFSYGTSCTAILTDSTSSQILHDPQNQSTSATPRGTQRSCPSWTPTFFTCNNPTSALLHPCPLFRPISTLPTSRHIPKYECTLAAPPSSCSPLYPKTRPCRSTLPKLEPYR